ncbi:MAG: hypothetical protein F4Y07_10090 [Gemmatimonadetes bacterium]|nr:hypothetical protein [Gemmatimonadota bacterium]
MALIASTAEVYLEDRMTPAAQTAAPDAQAEPSEVDDAPQDRPGPGIPDRTRYAGSFHSPELNTTYHLRGEGGAGLVLHAGRLDPSLLLAVSEGVLSGRRGMTLRFSALEDGRYQAMMVDAGRVKNLRFSRVEE